MRSGKPAVCVVGLGYIGLPTAAALATREVHAAPTAKGHAHGLSARRRGSVSPVWTGAPRGCCAQ